MPEREAPAIEVLLERQPHLTGLDVERTRALVERAPSRHPLEVEDDDALVGKHARADAAAGAERHDGRSRSWAQRTMRETSSVDVGPHDPRGLVRAYVAGADGEMMPRPEVAGVRDTVCGIVARSHVGEGAREACMRGASRG